MFDLLTLITHVYLCARFVSRFLSLLYCFEFVNVRAERECDVLMSSWFDLNDNIDDTHHRQHRHRQHQCCDTGHHHTAEGTMLSTRTHCLRTFHPGPSGCAPALSHPAPCASPAHLPLVIIFLLLLLSSSMSLVQSQSGWSYSMSFILFLLFPFLSFSLLLLKFVTFSACSTHTHTPTISLECSKFVSIISMV